MRRDDLIDLLRRCPEDTEVLIHSAWDDCWGAFDYRLFELCGPTPHALVLTSGGEHHNHPKDYGTDITSTIHAAPDAVLPRDVAEQSERVELTQLIAPRAELVVDPWMVMDDSADNPDCQFGADVRYALESGKQTGQGVWRIDYPNRESLRHGVVVAPSRQAALDFITPR